MRKNLLRVAPSVILLLLFVAMACQSKPNFETCGGQPTCIPPNDENAPAEVKKLREDLAGRWKLIRTFTRDTFHKTEREYRNLDRQLCISYDGGVQYFIENKVAACLLCYELKKGDKGLRIEVDHASSNAFCKQSFQSGDIAVAGDSLAVNTLDSFVVKRLVYRRLNPDGTIKAAN
jgi:hypothetical protein